MPDSITTLTQGLPVEIGKIDRALKQLWRDGEGAATRASLINFAVYCEGAEAMAQTTEAISKITQDHACRAILIGLDPTKTDATVQAWILAHCHLSRAGAKQVCCEQITFVLGKDGEEAFVRRDSMQIRGEGLIGLGKAPDSNSSQVIRYICEE